MRHIRYKRFHISLGIAVACLGMLIGISLSQVVITLPISNIYIVLLSAFLFLLLIRIRYYSFLPILIIALSIGYLHGNNIDASLQKLEAYAGKKIALSGIITEDPQQTARGDVRIVIGDISIDQKQYRGSIWATAKKDDYKRGDRITIKDTMKPGFGTFQLSATFVEVLHHTASNDPLIKLRDNFATALRKNIVEPAACLGIGFIIGQKSALPPELEDQLRVVGLTHLVVASGYNLTILMRFAKRLFENHSKFLVLFSSISLVVTFIAISGASPSMIRAGLVAGLSLIAWAYGRRFHPLILILVVAALTGMADPLYVWADIGWWLSFLAFFGVLIVSPLLASLFYKKGKAPAVMQLIFETISAQITTLPIILLVFGTLPVLAFVANMLTAPLIPIAMLATAIAGVAAMTVPFIAPLVSLPAEILLSYVIALVRTLSIPSWSLIEISISLPIFITVCVIFIAIVGVIWKKTNYNFRSQSVID